jgi:hypothetical protein
VSKWFLNLDDTSAAVVIMFVLFFGGLLVGFVMGKI